MSRTTTRSLGKNFWNNGSAQGRAHKITKLMSKLNQSVVTADKKFIISDVVKVRSENGVVYGVCQETKEYVVYNSARGLWIGNQGQL